MDKYLNFRQLSLHEEQGIDFEVSSRPGTTGIIIIAPHGGGIEPGTTELADAIAGDEHGFYSFKGIKKAHNGVLHITSTAFNEPCGIAAATSSRRTLALHGCKDQSETVFVGGLDEGLKARIKDMLRLAGFEARDSIEFPGTQPDNICNRNASGQGVQLELGRGLREGFFGDFATPAGRQDKTDKFFLFVDAIRRALE